MKITLPARKHKFYCFVTEQIVMEREPQWLINDVKTKIKLENTVHPGVYGFADVDSRNKFVVRLNNQGHGEIAHPCTLTVPPLQGL